MAWDLRGALLKKQEVESARLADFDFRLRARTMCLLGAAIDGDDPSPLVARIATLSDDAILGQIAEERPDLRETITSIYAGARAEARRQLIEELGDPSPHRLA